uniref:DDE Tnp4 domain-containing protein n=1 Tax=Romanomermis culicivorax TaxID=13658 RepID=A0A915KRC9_ROMCU
MAIVDSQYKFVIVDIGGKGSQNDSRTFKESTFGQILYSSNNGTLNLPEPANLAGTMTGCPHVFIADDALKLHQHVLKPFLGKTNELKQRVFNYQLSRARRCIENAFGILAARWRIFKKPLSMGPKNAHFAIKAAITLHNFLIDNNSKTVEPRYLPPNFVDYENTDGSVVSGQ